MPSRQVDKPIKILIFAASPQSQIPLALDIEVREIQRVLEGSRFQAIVYPAMRVQDLSSGLLSHQPDMIHFCGHAEAGRGIHLHDDRHGVQVFNEKGLVGLLRSFSKHLRCVVLNTCESEAPARQLARSIDFAIGMRSVIEDDVSIFFATAFYQSLAYGKTVDFAFHVARQAMTGVSSAYGRLPVLHRRKEQRAEAGWPRPTTKARRRPEVSSTHRAEQRRRAVGGSEGIQITGGTFTGGAIAVGRDSSINQVAFFDHEKDSQNWHQYLETTRRSLGL